MTKAELVEDVARAAELTKKDAERLVEIVFESIIETLNQGEKIELRGLAVSACASAARVGAKPEDRRSGQYPAKRVPYFKPGKELKELINDDNSGSPAATPSASPALDGQSSAARPLSCNRSRCFRLDRLWSPWRARYIASGVDSQSSECVFCRIANDAEHDEENLVVHRGRACVCGSQSLSLHQRAYDGGALPAHRRV